MYKYTWMGHTLSICQDGVLRIKPWSSGKTEGGLLFIKEFKWLTGLQQTVWF